MELVPVRPLPEGLQERIGIALLGQVELELEPSRPAYSRISAGGSPSATIRPSSMIRSESQSLAASSM